MAINTTAAATNDRREALVALRTTLAAQLDGTESNVHAQLAAQYRATLADIDEIDKAVKLEEDFASDASSHTPDEPYIA
jgi:hypothetical protein